MKLPKAINEGEMKIGAISVPVAVLEDGTRLLTTKGFLTALNRPWKGSYKKSELPNFLDAPNLRPYIKQDVLDVLEPVTFITQNGREATGYRAELLPLVCYVYVDAKHNSIIPSTQRKIVAHAEILLRSLAKVGIIAMVDEATGYQYIREKYELQSILQAYISEEILEWQKTFQLSFYKEIFRLWNIPFTPQNIKRKPSFIGILTNTLVYQNMPKGVFVLEKLKEKTPKTKGGNFKYRLHQSLTKEAGREALIKVLYSVEALASISENKKQFLRLIQEKYGQKELPFPNLNELDRAAEINEVDETPQNDFNTNLKGLLSVPKPPKDNK